MIEGQPHWDITATPAPECPAYEGESRADVAVIGAGFTGLTTALLLASRDADVVVLEAGNLGAEASGRTNGQVIPTLKKEDPDALLEHFGDICGERMIVMMRDAADDLFRLIEQYRIDCDAEQTGWIQPAHSTHHMNIVLRRHEQWSRYGADIELLDRTELSRTLGSHFYCGGWKANTGGHIQPLSLVRGLARSSIDQGARIHTQSPAIDISRNGEDWRISTPRGRILAKQVVLATNGATPPELSKPLSKTFIHGAFYQLATEPLSIEQQQRVLPGREAMSDMYVDIHGIRYDRESRLITGSTFINNRNWRQRLDSAINRTFANLFPDLEQLSYASHWSGVIGMTMDYFPRLYAPAPGLWAWTGCNGRGISLSTRMGPVLADAVCGKDVSQLPLPVSTVREIPLHSVLNRLLGYSLFYYRTADWFAHKFR
jgi:glycine/D-amino acid oxidase-like deaminating enzyme